MTDRGIRYVPCDCTGAEGAECPRCTGAGLWIQLPNAECPMCGSVDCPGAYDKATHCVEWEARG